MTERRIGTRNVQIGNYLFWESADLGKNGKSWREEKNWEG